MTAGIRIYLAGPLGFSEAGRHFYTTVLVPYVRGLGYEVLDPWTLTDARKIQAAQSMAYGPAKREAWRTLNLEMGATNRAAIDAARGRRGRPRRRPTSTAAPRRRSATRSRAASSSSATGATSA